MSRRIKVLIDDDTWAVLEQIPAGERNRTINNALRLWSRQRQRQAAVAEMEFLRAQLPEVSTAEVVCWVREDREQGH